jgi:hypothetical protein
VITELKLCRGSIRVNLEILKVIFRNIYSFLSKLKIESSHPLVARIWELAAEIISNDSSFVLWAIKFRFEMLKKETELNSLDFLKLVFA